MAGQTQSPATEASRIVDLAEQTLGEFLTTPKAGQDAIADATKALAPEVVAGLEKLVAKPNSYRDALLVALATPVVRGAAVDIRQRTTGGRPASDSIGKLLRKLHIRGVVGAYQNIGKNSSTLARGNNPTFDQVLTWGVTADLKQLKLAYRFVAAHVAGTARTVTPRPQLRPAQLTFGRVMQLISALLAEPSGGAHEQYITAALLDAATQQEGQNLRVETKAMSASDQSSGTAGDIEILQRGRLQEAIEVSAEPWATKLAQAEASLRDSGLQRAHVVAPVGDVADYGNLASTSDKDISILDPAALAATLVALLDRRGREFALLRLYELLDEKLADPALVNSYVARLQQVGLAESPAAKPV